MPPTKKQQSSDEAPARKASTMEGAGKSVAKRAAMSSDIPNSPLKRLKATIRERMIAKAARGEIILSTVDAYREFVTKEKGDVPDPDVDVVVVGTLIWKSGHEFGSRNLVRLHITDAEPQDTFEELVEIEDLYNSSKENESLVDNMLLTATIFGETVNSPSLPADGSRIRITNPRNRHVYDGRKCQLVTRASEIKIVSQTD